MHAVYVAQIMPSARQGLFKMRLKSSNLSLTQSSTWHMARIHALETFSGSVGNLQFGSQWTPALIVSQHVPRFTGS